MIKVAVKIDRELVRSAYDQNLVCTPELEIGKFTVIDARANGLIIPNTCRIFNDITSAKRNALSHNRMMGISQEFANRFMDKVKRKFLTGKDIYQ